MEPSRRGQDGDNVASGALKVRVGEVLFKVLQIWRGGNKMKVLEEERSQSLCRMRLTHHQR